MKAGELRKSCVRIEPQQGIKTEKTRREEKRGRNVCLKTKAWIRKRKKERVQVKKGRG